jgi:hemolysin III
MTVEGADRNDVLNVLPPPFKPRFRGVLHQWAFLASIPLGLTLVAVAQTGTAKVAALVYSLGAIALYGTSAAYHRGKWSDVQRAWMKRLDHSMIFVLIAATYTPICLLGLRGGGAVLTLIGVWAGAALGVVLGMAGIAEKRGVGMTLYLLIGWAAALSLPSMVQYLGPLYLGLIIAGGIAYTVGAVSLGTNWPNPRPATFGYHEVWHTFTLVAGACFAVVVWGLVLGAGPT